MWAILRSQTHRKADNDADYVGEDEADQDGLTPEILEARYERRLTVREW